MGPDCTEAEVYCIETARPQLPGPDCTEDSTEDLEEEELDTGQEEELRREEDGCTVYCTELGHCTDSTECPLTTVEDCKTDLFCKMD